MSIQFLMIVIISVCTPIPLNEDQPNLESGTIAKIVFMQDISKVSNEDLAEALRQLRDSTSRLENELTQGSVSTNEPPPTIDDSADDPEKSEVESSKMIEIERNLKLLKKIFMEKKRRKIEIQKEEQQKSELPETNDGSQNKLDVSESTLQAIDTESDNLEQNNLSDQNEQLAIDPAPQYKVPKKVFSGIVDAFELGNSLFLAGNLDHAIKYYELVPADKLSGFDRNWLELMIACSYRGKGDFESAEASYREVAGDPNGLHAADAAKNWLKYVATRKRLNGLVDEYGKKADQALQSAEMLLEKIADGKSN